MPHKAYSNIYLHITWHTKDNIPILEGEVRNFIYTLIRQICKDDREIVCFEVGGIRDHIHIALKVPPTMTISKWIGELKGSLSYNLNKAHPEIGFAWQTGYGVTSFSQRDLKGIVSYIKNQESHHMNNNMIKELEIIS